MDQTHAMLNNLLGLDNKIVALTIMLVTYIFLFSEKFNRAVVALLGAATMLLFGIINQERAQSSIDFNTINLLIGMMIIVTITEQTGVFQFLGLWAVKKVRASPRGILAAIAVLTAVLSGFVDNVTTVLLITPVVLQIGKALDVKCFPYLMMVIFACNIGGAATLIGDPPNIIVASRIGLSFKDFIYHMMPLAYLLIVLLIVVFDFIWGRQLYATPAKKEEVMHMCAVCQITNLRLLKKCLSVLFVTILCFIFSKDIGLSNGAIAITGAAVMMLLHTMGDDKDTEDAKMKQIFSNIDWVTIFFFIGLFIIVGGIEDTGLLGSVGQQFADWANGSIIVMMMSFMWLGSFISMFLDNIPFIVTMIPIVEGIENSMHLGEDFRPIWWAVLMGTCFGGNGTLIASSANVIVAGLAAKERRRIGFIQFMQWGVPVTIGSVIVSSAYVYFRYL